MLVRTGNSSSNLEKGGYCMLQISAVLRLFGPQVMAKIQDKWGARLFFNTLVPFEDGLIKYGVISKDALLSDLLDWESLYAAGRLHKPVLILEKNIHNHVGWNIEAHIREASSEHQRKWLYYEASKKPNKSRSAREKMLPK